MRVLVRIHAEITHAGSVAAQTTELNAQNGWLAIEWIDPLQSGLSALDGSHSCNAKRGPIERLADFNGSRQRRGVIDKVGTCVEDCDVLAVGRGFALGLGG